MHCPLRPVGVFYRGGNRIGRVGDFQVDRDAEAASCVAARSVRQWTDPSAYPRPAGTLPEVGPSSRFTGSHAANGPAGCEVEAAMNNRSGKIRLVPRPGANCLEFMRALD